jgi:hypothetical protein
MVQVAQDPSLRATSDSFAVFLLHLGLDHGLLLLLLLLLL